ncbi:glyoxalase/bleomycin resistance protein/dioxygenase [Sphingomonas sp. MM-1]|uniref:VOC family protein n=1 Tax=Sphingomonas sp. MM-1 TaxID=745310 RepID=UPI0002C07BC6|nr:VOC family protein [Sphingomonas sp. MM-1]AGH49268.1 glyoxalase/bleomycin resistance protein/dioxygenase [Sphingomonas sp. MM-1]
MAGTNRGAFHHIDLCVSDIEASIRVYGPVLEYMGYRRVSGGSGAEWDLPAEGRGASLGLIPCDPALKDHGYRRYAPGVQHIAWRAESREDVDRLHALLVEQGIKVLDPPAHYPQYSGDYYALFFEDLDGIKLEYAHTPGWL